MNEIEKTNQLPPSEPDSILVIDDDPELCSYLEFLLKEEGYQVMSALNGAEGEKMALNLLPSLIILDINLPTVGGYELLRRLKAQETTRDIPVVMLSAATSIASHHVCAEEGAAGFLDKPLNVDELLGMLRRCLS